MPDNTLINLAFFADTWRRLKREVPAADATALDCTIEALAEAGFDGPAIVELLIGLLGSSEAIRVWSSRLNTLGNPDWFRQFGDERGQGGERPWLNWGAEQPR